MVKKLSSFLKIYLLFTLFISCKSYSQLPEGFGYILNEIPTIETELRYFGENNFIGKPIEGYRKPVLIVSSKAIIQLKKVQNDLQKQNLGLKVFDAYRPQRAVNHFVRWAKELNDTIQKSSYYPNVEKRNLFKEGYIASKSGHTRGSTLDLTIINLKTKEELDMGSPYDFFGKESWVNHQNLTYKQKENRQLLQQTMLKHNFRNYPQEWWHFSLRNEPFPNTYFDFPVE